MTLQNRDHIFSAISISFAPPHRAKGNAMVFTRQLVTAFTQHPLEGHLRLTTSTLLTSCIQHTSIPLLLAAAYRHLYPSYSVGSWLSEASLSSKLIMYSMQPVLTCTTPLPWDRLEGVAMHQRAYYTASCQVLGTSTIIVLVHAVTWVGVGVGVAYGAWRMAWPSYSAMA